ncbi:hypothetical protein ACFPA8_15005 [Streptomyces ovatisporus]|uniref:TfoX N-terminal domain-containing protein n=1 Tax=Streptomyces ovatisporus TaxID=1128682 RepID=A0ABV9A932_9ACTN
MSTTPTPPARTDDELAALDPASMLRYGLSFGGAHRTALFGDGAICAAVRLDRLGVQPRAAAFVAKIVRSGGVRYAAALPAPVPGDEAAALVRSWLESASDVATDPDGDETCARWLEAVAEILVLRHVHRQR